MPHLDIAHDILLIITFSADTENCNYMSTNHANHSHKLLGTDITITFSVTIVPTFCYLGMTESYLLKGKR